MKKTSRKLVVRHETLQVLRDKSLSHAVGGGGGGVAPLERETGRACTVPAVATAACNG